MTAARATGGGGAAGNQHALTTLEAWLKEGDESNEWNASLFGYYRSRESTLVPAPRGRASYEWRYNRVRPRRLTVTRSSRYSPSAGGLIG